MSRLSHCKTEFFSLKSRNSLTIEQIPAILPLILHADFRACFLFCFGAIAHTALDNAVGVALGSVVTLVVELFAAAKSYLDLDA